MKKKYKIDDLMIYINGTVDEAMRTIIKNIFSSYYYDMIFFSLYSYSKCINVLPIKKCILFVHYYFTSEHTFFLQLRQICCVFLMISSGISILVVKLFLIFYQNTNPNGRVPLNTNNNNRMFNKWRVENFSLF